MSELSEFNSLVNHCDTLLKNAQLDCIEWKEGMNKELWETKSFFANNTMKTASDYWDEYRNEMTISATKSKPILEQLISVKQNDRVLFSVQEKVNKLCQRLQLFKEEYRMDSPDVLRYNYWFREFRDLVDGYSDWLNAICLICFKSNDRLPNYLTHEKLMKALVFSINANPNRTFENAYEELLELWYFINSDNASFNGSVISKQLRPLSVNPVVVGTHNDFSGYYNAEISYCKTRNNIEITESDFIVDTLNWIDKVLRNEKLLTERKRKLQEFSAYLNERRSDNKKSNSGVSNADKQLSFPECFVSDQLYNEFIQLMVANNHLSAENHSSIATEKGNVSFLPAVIKALRNKGYYRAGVKLTNQMIKGICEKHFNHPVSYDTVKKAKPSDFNLNFIVVVPKMEN